MNLLERILKRNDLTEDEKIKHEILKLDGLCPICKNNFKDGSFFSKEDFPYVYSIVICSKCVKKQRVDLTKAIEAINQNPRVFSALMYEKAQEIDKSVVGKEVEKINTFKPHTAWVLDDKEYFEANPDKKYRARKIFFGELEETYEHDISLKDSVKKNGICYAIVHKLNDEDRVISYVNDISLHPIHDDKFIAAMFFFIMQNKLQSIKNIKWDQEDPEKIIYDLYEEIKTKKDFMEELEILTKK